MNLISDFLFELFWIITGLTANIIGLVLSFFIFVVIWKCIFKGGKEDV